MNVFVQNENIVDDKPSEEEIKRKIENLRKLKQEGTISEEEFKDEMLKLL